MNWDDDVEQVTDTEDLSIAALLSVLLAVGLAAIGVGELVAYTVLRVLA